jgi:hypothetical protein
LAFSIACRASSSSSVATIAAALTFVPVGNDETKKPAELPSHGSMSFE